MTTRTILLASVIVTLVIALVNVTDVYAEIPEHVKAKINQADAKLAEHKEAKEEAKAAKHHAEKTSKEHKADKAHKDYMKLVGEINKHGIATEKQFKENPNYWRQMNMPDVPVSNGASAPTMSTEAQVDSIGMIEEGLNQENTSTQIELMGSCFCPQKLFVIAGFDYRTSSNWWGSGFASSWEEMEIVGDTAETSVETSQTHFKVYPHITYTLQKSGSANFDLISYRATSPSGTSLGSSDGFNGITTSKVWTDYGRIFQTSMSTPPAQTVITFETGLNSIS